MRSTRDKKGPEFNKETGIDFSLSQSLPLKTKSPGHLPLQRICETGAKSI
jgi:hypothetical protein